MIILNMWYILSNFIFFILKLVFCFILYVLDCIFPYAGGYVFVWLDHQMIQLPPSIHKRFGS
jgi:hypothetical protein